MKNYFGHSGLEIYEDVEKHATRNGSVIGNYFTCSTANTIAVR